MANRRWRVCSRTDGLSNAAGVWLSLLGRRDLPAAIGADEGRALEGPFATTVGQYRHASLQWRTVHSASR